MWKIFVLIPKKRGGCEWKWYVEDVPVKDLWEQCQCAIKEGYTEIKLVKED